jgi:hypothetical protein
MLQVLRDCLAASRDLIHHRRSQEDATGEKSALARQQEREKQKAKRKAEERALQNRRQFVVWNSKIRQRSSSKDARIASGRRQ